MIDFKFKVVNYARTLENHKGKLDRYREECANTPGLKYDWTRVQDKAVFEKKTPKGWAYMVLAQYNGSAIVTCTNKKSVRTLVNSFFWNHITQYLRGADLPLSWSTAVYLDCYDKLNKFMNEVANAILEEV